MEIYVLSAGLYEGQDYFWQKITQAGQKPVEEPNLVKQFKFLLETEAYSILIGRESNRLILLVTGMKASKRRDYQGRTIRNSLALIFQDNQDNEQKIRGIAVLALEDKDKLQQEIDRAIQEDKTRECGFAVDYQIIDTLINTNKLVQTENSTVTKLPLIGKNSAENRKTIANNLKESLPQKKNPQESKALVVVTGIKAEDTLINVGVWRGLSSLVKKEQLTKYDPPNSAQKIFPSRQKTETLNLKIIIALLTSLGVIGIIALQFFNFIAIGNKNNPRTALVASISSGAKNFVTIDNSGKIIVQNLEKESNKTINNESKISITSVALSANGNYLVVGDEQGNIQLWNVNDKKKIDLETDKNLKHEQKISSLAINSENNKIKIVSGGADGQVLLWTGDVDVQEGTAKIYLDIFED